jgi:hypothetical protein
LLAFAAVVVGAILLARPDERDRSRRGSHGPDCI